ncbi:MAG: hypothetical protein JW940_06915 [Polyangiaceae bacterium]|nr:hypothetical protein [Polyangiaceae bacterium]
MKVDPASLDSLSRDELILRARNVGAQRPEVLTRVELKDEIVRLSEDDEISRRQARGWLGVARDLVASVVEQRLNLPDAAAFIRKRVPMTAVVLGPPVATVTLAEIYASQGHLGRALKMLDEVLENEPDHVAARQLRDRLRNRLEETGAEFEPVSEEPDEPEAPVPAAEPEANAPAAVAAPEPKAPAAVASPEPEAQAAVAAPEPEAPAVLLRPTDVSGLTPQPEPSTGAEPKELERLTPEEPAADDAAVAEPLEPTHAVPAQPTEAQAEPTKVSEAQPPETAERVLKPSIDALMWWTDAAGLHVYWEVTAETAEYARTELEAPLSVKLVELVPGWEKTERIERELSAVAAAGHETLEPLAPGAVVRAALGAQSRGRWVPLALGVELVPDADDLADALGWVPLGSGPWQSARDEFDAVRGRALGRRN